MNRILLLLSLFALAACQGDANRADAYGNFEATEVIVSAEANGRLVSFDLEEGQRLAAGQLIGQIDTMQLHLKKQQLRASIRAVLSKQQNIASQMQVFDEQKANLQREITRVEKLLADGAATPKQLDDLQGQLAVVKQQEAAQLTRLTDANQGIASEVKPLEQQIAQLDDQIQRSLIRNPIAGRVLAKYAEPQEVTAFGKPLYKIADTEEMLLRVYVMGSQLDAVALGDQVAVFADRGQESLHEFDGTVRWVASEAEFTPKVIQTKEERVNLVYAVKVAVPNPDGLLKIGMPGEMRLE